MRQVQDCDECGRRDVHPRHHTWREVVLTSSAEAGEDAATEGAMTASGAVHVAHWDCCAASGCRDCTERLASIPEASRHGDALVSYITEVVER